MKTTPSLMILALFATVATPAATEEKSQGPWDMSRVTWYRAHPSETTAKLKWCVENSKGDAECGAAMQACGDLLEDDPKAECQSPTAH
jgi:hypothetical protein